MKIITSLIVIFLTINIAKSQTIGPALNTYPLSVVMKVQDVTSVIPLTSDRQVQFANFFQKEISLAQSVQQSSVSGNQTEQLRTNLCAEFATLLSPSELALYSDRKKGSEYAKSTVTDVAN